MLKNLKEEIRQHYLSLLRKQKGEERDKKSLVILEKILALPEFQKARVIFCYASFDGEVETFRMMKQAMIMGKRIALPTILRQQRQMLPIEVDHLDDLQEGAYGIQQPCLDMNRCLSADELDLCLVPGVAFDRTGNRLGRGAGYYDRFLQSLPMTVPTVGLAFRFQVLDDLPSEAHDIPVQRVISD